MKKKSSQVVINRQSSTLQLCYSDIDTQNLEPVLVALFVGIVFPVVDFFMPKNHLADFFQPFFFKTLLFYVWPNEIWSFQVSIEKSE